MLPASQCVLNLNLGQFKKSMNFQWYLAGFGDLQLILIVFEGGLHWAVWGGLGGGTGGGAGASHGCGHHLTLEKILTKAVKHHSNCTPPWQCRVCFNWGVPYDCQAP